MKRRSSHHIFSAVLALVVSLTLVMGATVPSYGVGQIEAGPSPTGGSIILQPAATATFTAIPFDQITPSSASGPRESVTALVIDVSGSMNDPEASGASKLTGAINASLLVLDRMIQEYSLSQANFQAGLVTFNSAARVAIAPTNDLEAVKQAVQGMKASGNTNLGDGLTKALDILQTAAVTPKAIILLSDGLPTEGLSAREDFLAGPVARAKSLGVCVHTVGLGEGGKMNAELLWDIAQGSGCGKYYQAKDAFQLAATYILLSHEMLGQQNVKVWEDTITQDEEKMLGDYAVPADQELLDISLLWPGSKLTSVILDPNNRPVVAGYPGLQTWTTPSSLRLVIAQPMVGNWRLGIRGVDVPEGIMPVSMAVSMRSLPKKLLVVAEKLPTSTPIATSTPRPTLQPTLLPSPTPTPVAPPPDGGAGWLLLALIGGIGGLVAVLFLARRRRVQGGPWLEVTGGAHAGHRIAVPPTSFRIGRAQGNDLVLDDPSVAQSQAQIRFAGSSYVLDDPSGNTYVNGQRVLQATLQPGDRIRLGSTEFIFGRR